MNITEIIQQIITQSTTLKDKYTDKKSVSNLWVCIFSQSEEEYQRLLAEAKDLGNIFEDTPSGPKILLREPIAGARVLKVRQFDPTKTERGDVDFSISDYKNFKAKYLQDSEHFKLIERDTFEMIELMESGGAVRAYFSNPPIEEQYKNIL